MSEEEILNSDDIRVVSNINFLTQKCQDTTIENGEDIANKLFRVLNSRADSYGLAANQIGIQKNVCVINVKSPIYLINPKIINPSGQLIFFESCVSFPGKRIRTNRYTTFTIKSDNLDEELYIDVSGESNYVDNLNVIEAIVLQHEISHLDGKTIFDYEYIQPQLRNENKYGRNDKINVTNGIDVICIKYKHLDQFIKKGYRLE